MTDMLDRTDALDRALGRGFDRSNPRTDHLRIPVPTEHVAPGPVVRWTCTWHTGPDAGTTQSFGVGRHLLGRAPALMLRADDPSLEAHHALVEARPDGTLAITQLTGRGDLTVDGASVIHTTAVADGSWVEVGHSMVQFTRAGEHPHSVGAEAGHETRAGARIEARAVQRATRATPRWNDITIAQPVEPVHDPGAHHGSLLPALCGLAGAGLLAMVLRQPMFFVFGMLGAFVAVAGWATQHVATVRRHRLARRTYDNEVADARAAIAHARRRHREFLAASVPTLADAVATLTARDERLWARRTIDEPVVVSAGVADTVSPVDGEPLRGVSLAVSLAPGARVALTGAQATAVARALLVQLAANYGPADVRVVVVTDRPDEWDWIARLPHCLLPDGSPALVRDHVLGHVLDELHHRVGDRRGHLVFVTDRPALLGTRTSPLRRALAEAGRHALLAIATDGSVPHVCTTALHTTAGPGARYTPDLREGGLPTLVRVAAIGRESALRCVAGLHDLLDPEDPLMATAAMPRSVSLAELWGGLPDAEAIIARWAAAGPDPSPRATVGVAADGVVDIDLVRDGPHGLIAGTTGAGKSELLRTMVVGMACNASPEHLALVLVDYKGGSTFDACAVLPHVVGVITDLDDRMADRALRSLHAELRRREGVLRAHGAPDLAMLHHTRPDVTMPRLVVVVDEFAALVAEQPTFLHALVGVAQRGRSLGVHLLLATQRPNGVISDDVRANTNLRLALRVHDAADAIDVVGTTTPTTLPRQVPGRAVLRLAPDDHLMFQTAHCTVVGGGTGRCTPLELTVRAVADAAKRAALPAPAPPWCPPLPAVLHADSVDPTLLGIIDDPDHQTTLPLTWSPDDGHVLIAGSTGSGVSTALYLLALRALAGGADVYVVDAQPRCTSADLDVERRDLHVLTRHPGCGAVVRLHEHERVARLLRLAVRRAHSRDTGDESDGDSVRRTVVVIDGLDALRRALDEPARVDDSDLLVELLTLPPGGEVSLAVGTERVSSVPSAFLAQCATRWVGHLHDPHDAAALGVHASLVPGSVVPGRVVIAGSGLHAQLVLPDAATPEAHGTRPAAEPVQPLAAIIDPSLLPPPSCVGDATEISIGLAFDDGRLARLTMHAGEHLLIAGPARSGRTTALAHVAAAWRAAHPDGWVGVVRGRRAPVDALAERSGGSIAPDAVDDASSVAAQAAGHSLCRAVLVVVDDAEMVDDHDGALAALARDGRSTIVAAGNPDALRQVFGHWTTIVRRSRCGLVATGGSELDGDLLGMVLPRRTPVTPRPGLMWSVAAGRACLVQVVLHGR